jgi:cation diffusion facilitator family transporter
MKNARISKRQQKGQQTGLIGLFTNLVLFAGKFFAGLLSNSIAIMADSFNNLTDCASSVVTIIGFSFAKRKADEGHPFGHGRIEYVSGLIVSIVIVVTGILVGDEVIHRILDPQPVTSSALAIIICAVAILVKIGLAVYYRQANRKVKSSAVTAVKRDSISDAFATAIALSSMLIAPLTDIPVDGYFGIVVTLFILWSGLKSLGENISLIMGQGLKSGEREAIQDMIQSYGLFKYASALDVHDYGPESKILLVKVHLAKNPHSDESVAELMKAKQEIGEKFGFEEVTIYWPPNS